MTSQEILNKIKHARENRTEFINEMKQRQKQGLEIAQQSAEILKTQFGVQRVVLFGSMLDPQEMSHSSDIDLAVFGLPETDIFKAGAAIERGHDFPIDLVEIEKAKPHIIKAIEQGIEL